MRFWRFYRYNGLIFFLGSEHTYILYMKVDRENW